MFFRKKKDNYPAGYDAQNPPLPPFKAFLEKVLSVRFGLGVLFQRVPRGRELRILGMRKGRGGLELM